MKDFIYTEKFDNYLKGKLDRSEKLTLDENIQQDPLLKNEVNLQLDIFEALHEERKMLLKQRLDNVPVNTVTWANITGLQWVAILGSVLLLSTAIYYSYFDEVSSKNETKVDLVNNNLQQQISPYHDIPEVPTSNIEIEKIPIDNQLSQASQNNESTMTLQSPDFEVVSNVENTEPEPSIPNITRPQIVSNFTDENEDIDYRDFEVPDKNLFEKDDARVSEVTIETVADSKYPFHYQMMDQKLYLHGDFKGIPYKIIALNQGRRRQLFLQYESSYYLLNQRQVEIVPLERITDSTIVKALNRLNQ